MRVTRGEANRKPTKKFEDFKKKGGMVKEADIILNESQVPKSAKLIKKDVDSTLGSLGVGVPTNKQKSSVSTEKQQQSKERAVTR